MAETIKKPLPKHNNQVPFADVDVDLDDSDKPKRTLEEKLLAVEFGADNRVLKGELLGKAEDNIADDGTVCLDAQAAEEHDKIIAAGGIDDNGDGLVDDRPVFGVEYGFRDMIADIQQSYEVEPYIPRYEPFIAKDADGNDAYLDEDNLCKPLPGTGDNLYGPDGEAIDVAAEEVSNEVNAVAEGVDVSNEESSPVNAFASTDPAITTDVDPTGDFKAAASPDSETPTADASLETSPSDPALDEEKPAIIPAAALAMAAPAPAP